MNTDRNNLILLCSFCVSIIFSSVNCNQNGYIKILQPVFGKTNSYLFVKPGNANVTVTDISQNRIVPSKRIEEYDTIAKPSLNQALPADRHEYSLNTTERMIKYGYKPQEYNVVTKDGYKLTLFRIYGKGPVVFLMHDFAGSSDDFVVSGPSSLAFVLADAGYDVWLGNNRGNKYSREHKYLDPHSKRYWDFGFDLIGIYDLPAMVDLALKVSKTYQMTYIGHGQGTTVFFILTSEKPDYNEKFDIMISLGTIAWIWHIESPPIRALEPITNAQFQYLEDLGYYEILKNGQSPLCCSSRLALVTCKTRLFSVVGYDYDQIDYEYACEQVTNYPAGASLRTLQHYIQLIRSREFVKFDFGREKNLQVYGSRNPPYYDVERITTPVVIFFGENDLISTLDDTLILVQRLNDVKIYRVPHDKFNHRNFIDAKDIYQLVYWKILDILEETICGRCAGRGSKCIELCYDCDRRGAKCIGKKD